MRGALWPKRGITRPFVYLAKRLPRLSATPHAIAAGFASGAACSFTPLLGFHFVLSFVVAFIVRGNMLAAALGTIVGNPLTFPFIFAATYETGRWIYSFIDGEKMPDSEAIESQSEELIERGLFSVDLDQLWPVLTTMMVGAVPLGIITFAVSYIAVRSFVVSMQRARMRRRARREPLEDGNTVPPAGDL
ncbi:MAG: DUF2062 domain-containing protein [Salinarimonas sp.]|nr:DUF2062 domain-containing protein [Salinarimonas sp.]